MAKILKGEVVGANADAAAAKEINPKISDSFAAYNVGTVGAEMALPAVEAPVATSSTSEPIAPAAEAPPPAADCSSAETHWKSAESIGTLAAYNDHLARFPNCVFSTLAAARIEALIGNLRVDK